MVGELVSVHLQRCPPWRKFALIGSTVFFRMCIGFGLYSEKEKEDANYVARA